MDQDIPRTLPPLFEAIRRLDDDELAAAIAAGEDVNALDPSDAPERRSTVMHFAAMFGRAPAIKRLAAAGANVNAQDAGGSTPLLLAIVASGLNNKWMSPHALDNAQALLDAGATIDMPRTWGTFTTSPLHEAARLGNLAAVRWLVEHGHPVDAGGWFDERVGVVTPYRAVRLNFGKTSKAYPGTSSRGTRNEVLALLESLGADTSRPAFKSRSASAAG
ncbi:ankyrin repeat domain-containing protein [Burkholderia cenocepacia]|uniref:ankyrin repeat domain-containing protein n=1 Tax=Burkholderia cenocepacia TaxID=95486 RepID=UPI001B8FFBAB|nr:ankyrin repeat domain-containing protein [Burkholderia cenocepacia]MBR7945425.1 ankyrin repeat domain-containing protein [Burkholderia cenocepacia]